MSGIRTLEDLRLRCLVDDITGCWLWRGALTESGRPSMWVPQIGSVGSLGTLLSLIKTGKRPPKGTCWIPTCANTLCANPEHRKRGDYSQLQKLVRPTLTPLHKARIARGRRAISKCYSAEAANDIRTSTETLEVVAARWGMDKTMASRVRRGEAWKDLGASAFAWKGAA